MSETFQAFSSKSYGDYLDALGAFQNGPSTTAPNQQDYMHAFSLAKAAQEPERIPGRPETWQGTIAVYSRAGDDIPSGWVIKTTLRGELEGIHVLSDTENPLPDTASVEAPKKESSVENRNVRARPLHHVLFRWFRRKS